MYAAQQNIHDVFTTCHNTQTRAIPYEFFTTDDPSFSSNDDSKRSNIAERNYEAARSKQDEDYRRYKAEVGDKLLRLGTKIIFGSRLPKMFGMLALCMSSVAIVSAYGGDAVDLLMSVFCC